MQMPFNRKSTQLYIDNYESVVILLLKMQQCTPRCLNSSALETLVLDLG